MNDIESKPSVPITRFLLYVFLNSLKSLILVNFEEFCRLL